MENSDLRQYLDACCDIALKAGEVIMPHWRSDVKVQAKEDKSPVTEADIAANHYICAALAQLTPHIPVVAEENENQPELHDSTFWLVDPLDGTRSFVRGEDEFTVNIGLIKAGQPVLGVIYVPVLKTLYFGAESIGAFKQQTGVAAEAITVRTPAEDGLVVVRSKSHMSEATEKFLSGIKVKDILPGSSSLKFCLIADGSADIYPRMGRTMEWDTAAGHAILNAAGGRVEMVGGKPLTYHKPDFANPHFVAYGA